MEKKQWPKAIDDYTVAISSTRRIDVEGRMRPRIPRPIGIRRQPRVRATAAKTTVRTNVSIKAEMKSMTNISGTSCAKRLQCQSKSGDVNAALRGGYMFVIGARRARVSPLEKRSRGRPRVWKHVPPATAHCIVFF